MDRSGIFEGNDPMAIVSRWLNEAEGTEPNDPSAMALATVDESGLPNVRMVLLKGIENGAFVFYTNYGSVKARELKNSERAAFVLHWKSLPPPGQGARLRNRRGRSGRRPVLRHSGGAKPDRCLGIASVPAAVYPAGIDGQGGEDGRCPRAQSETPALLGRFQDLAR